VGEGGGWWGGCGGGAGVWGVGGGVAGGCRVVGGERVGVGGGWCCVGCGGVVLCLVGGAAFWVMLGDCERWWMLFVGEIVTRLWVGVVFLFCAGRYVVVGGSGGLWFFAWGVFCGGGVVWLRVCRAWGVGCVRLWVRWGCVGLVVFDAVDVSFFCVWVRCFFVCFVFCCVRLCFFFCFEQIFFFSF